MLRNLLRRKGKTSDEPAGCGCLFLVGLGLLIAAGSCASERWSQYRDEQTAQEQAAREAAESQQRKAALIEQQRRVEEKLRTFGEQHVPELQRMIDDVSRRADELRRARGALLEELVLLGRDPAQDKTYLRWGRQLEAWEQELAGLKHEREEVYLAYRKMELSPVNEKEYGGRLEQAKQVAGEVRQRIEKAQEDLERGN